MTAEFQAGMFTLSRVQRGVFSVEVAGRHLGTITRTSMLGSWSFEGKPVGPPVGTPKGKGFPTATKAATALFKEMSR